MLEIKETDVGKIIELTIEMQQAKFYPAKRKILISSLTSLKESEKWLLNFCCWQCLFNSRFKAIDADKLCLYEPAKTNKTTFQDFLKIVKKFDSKRVSPSRLKPLLQFLANCDEKHRNFYLALFTKDFINYFPALEIQTLLDLDSISGEKVYGEPEYLKTSFSELRYPVSLRRISSKKLTPYIIAKEPLSTMLLTKTEEGYKRVVKSPHIKIDIKLSTTPRFAVAGFYDSDTYYPTDCFSYWESCAVYLKGIDLDQHLYSNRISDLNNFVDRSMLVHTDSSKSYFATSEQEVIDAIADLAKGSMISDILVLDSESTRTGEAYRIICRTASGIIESVSENYISVWANGELVNCYYKFEGKEQALLTAPELLKDRVMEFYYVKIGNTEYSIGKGVCWHRERWREMRLRGTNIWIDKCALCGSTQHKHANRGVCISCEANLHYYYDTYGVGNWIQPSQQMIKKRYESVWKPSALNLVKYRYKGTTLEANETGEWRFTQGDLNEQD